MIELRWEQKMKQHEDGYQIGPFRVLQYRYRSPTWDTSVNAFPPTDWQWSEWIDAPEE